MRNVYILTIIFIGFIVISCTEPIDDEAQIRDRVDSMVMATEAKEMISVLAPIDKDFLGNNRIRRVNLRGLVLVHFQRNKNVYVLVNNLQIELDSQTEAKTAKVHCNVVMAGRNKTLPETGRVLSVESLWHKEDGEWFVISAKWRDPIVEYMR